MTRKHAPTYQAHMARYVWAMTHCYKKNVIDAGGGEGFGTHLLSQVASKVLLTDIDDRFLTNARSWFKWFCPVDILQCDLNKDFPATTDGVDTVVAFEVIEHLENPEVFLANVKKTLKPGGKLVFSVPYMLKADEHKHLFNKTSIYQLISKHLVVDKLFDQFTNLDGSPMQNWSEDMNIQCIVGVATK